MSTAAIPLIRALEASVLGLGLDALAFGRRLTSLSDQAPDPGRALRNLQRILEAGFSTSLLKDLVSHPVLLEVCFDLVGQSEYLADIIVRDPELLRWLTATDVLTRSRSADELEAEARQTMGLFERPERRLDALRRFHRREMLRIGAREILQEGSVEAVTAELSALADVSARCVTDLAHYDLNARLGSTLPNRMAVVALGKLGGEELNFSSDIDLLFVYDEDGDLPQAAGRLHTWHEYHARLAEAIVRGLAEFTGEGQLYRVDMRLRPDGRSGPLAMSRGAMMTYYESRGAAWERQMLLKARVIAGDREVGERFLRDLQPFVFPRTALRAPWVEILGMKQAIERDASVESNIKLGAGGIRDIEFLVQGLQLLFAGQDPTLRTGHTLRALDRLIATGHIQATDGGRLREAYEFFRTIEHRLQLLHGRQTHQLPETSEENRTLGRKLGFSGADRFKASVELRRRFVRSQFDAFTRPQNASETAEPDLSEVIGSALTTVDWPEELRTIAAQRLSSFGNDRTLRRLLETALQNPRHRSWLIRAALLAPRLVERMSVDPLLMESLIGNADILLRQTSTGWSELRRSELSRYQAFNEARTVVRHLMGRIDGPSMERELSGLAEEVLGAVVERAGLDPSGIGILALGKFGGRELAIGSDLDLVVVFRARGVERTVAEQTARSIAQGFASVPPLYRVDFRLRPEGRNAPLAVEAGYLEQYLRERAEPWELLALTRARLVWGDKQVGSRMLSAVRREARSRPGIRAAYLRTMRSAMTAQRVQEGMIDLKLSSGGIADVEFVAQMAAIVEPKWMGRSTADILKAAVRARLLTKRLAAPLLEGLAYLRRLETLVRLNVAATDSVLPSDPTLLKALAVGCGAAGERELRRDLSRVMKQNRRSFLEAIAVLERPRRRGR